MELYHLRTFVAVAEEGRLSRAAERLFTSQPAISAHIKALEEELGVALFTRTPRGMVLTDAGRRLETRARQALLSAEAVLSDARSLRTDLEGAVRLGVNTDIDFLRAIDICSALSVRHPSIQPQIIKTTSMTTPDRLRGGDLEGGFVYGECPVSDMALVEICRAPMYAVGPRAWADRVRGAGWQDIADLPWLWMTWDCPIQNNAVVAFQQRGFAPNVVMRADDEGTFLSLIRAGKGLALLREDEAVAAVQSGHACMWETQITTIPVSFAYWRDREGDRLVRALLDAVRQVWAC